MFLIICLTGLAGIAVSTVLIYIFYFKNKPIVLPYIIFIVCTIIFAGGAFLYVKGGIDFGKGLSEPLDLTGEWKQVNSNDDDSYQIATISENTIEVYWYTESDETKALYWAGTFSAPETDEKSYSWDSENDKEKTGTALLSSDDETKTFTFNKGKISYEVSAFGVTQTVILEKNESKGNTGMDSEKPVDELQEDLKSVLNSDSMSFYKNVQNDATGKWRLLVYNSNENILNHIVKYYDAYFESDDEVHLVVNQGLQTTTTITKTNGSLDVSVHEYVENEESDAKTLGCGNLLNSYVVDLSSGEIKDLSNITNAAGDHVSLESIESSIIGEISEEYQSSKWFYVNCDTYMDESISVDMQIDQGTADTDAALALAAEYFELAKNEVEKSGAEFAIFHITVVNNGSPIGLFSTEDGKNFSFISNGKREEITLS